MLSGDEGKMDVRNCRAALHRAEEGGLIDANCGVRASEVPVASPPPPPPADAKTASWSKKGRRHYGLQHDEIRLSRYHGFSTQFRCSWAFAFLSTWQDKY